MGKFDFDAIRAAVESEDSATDKRRKPPEERTYFKWSPELTDKLTALIDQQKTAEEISAELGVPLDKVRSKLTALKAKVPTALPRKLDPITPVPVAEPAELLHIPAEPQGSKPKQNELLDRVVFYALDELVLRLQADGEDPAMTFRCALDMIDLWAEGAAWTNRVYAGSYGTLRCNRRDHGVSKNHGQEDTGRCRRHRKSRLQGWHPVNGKEKYISPFMIPQQEEKSNAKTGHDPEN